MENLIFLNRKSIEYHDKLITGQQIKIKSQYTGLQNETQLNRYSVNTPKHFELTNKEYLKNAVTKLNGDTWLDVYLFGCTNNGILNPYKHRLQASKKWNAPIPYVPSEYALDLLIKHLNGKGISEVKIGLKSDPLMWMDSKYGATKYLLNQLAERGIKYTIYTTSDLGAHNDYLELCINRTMFRKQSDNDYIERRINPGSPSILRREKAAEKLNAVFIKGWTNDTPVKKTQAMKQELRRQFGVELPNQDIY